MKQYHDYLNHILKNGITKKDRTGTGTISTFGYQMRFDLTKSFPLITTKKLHFKSIAIELLWFLKGDTNTKFLNDNGVTIWDKWALKDDYFLKPKGYLGSIYGEQWVSWQDYNTGDCINQIEQVIKQLKTNPDSRRIIVSAWNVADLPDESLTPEDNIKNGKMALAPCHAFFQFYVKPLDVFQRINTLDLDIWINYFKKANLEFWSDEASEVFKKEWIEKANKALDEYGVKKASLSCLLTQRSADSFLGVPYNIASYALLTHMIAQQCDLEVGEFIWSGGDCHIYLNHLEQVKLQLSRDPFKFALPKINIKKASSIFDYTYDDFELINYESYPHIKGDISI